MTALKINDTGVNCRIDIPVQIFSGANLYTLTFWAYISSNTTHGRLISFEQQNSSDNSYLIRNYYNIPPYDGPINPPLPYDEWIFISVAKNSL